MKKVKSIIVFGKRWLERPNGNTYHTTDIFINGEFKHHTQMVYGYGDCYEQTAREWLVKNNIIPDITVRMSQYCRENGISYNARVVDVQRKRDL